VTEEKKASGKRRVVGEFYMEKWWATTRGVREKLSSTPSQKNLKQYFGK
jgi:hypothetical protein